MITLNSDIFPAGADAYIVGGTIRDILLGRAPADFDITVPGNPSAFAAQIAAANGGRIVPIGKVGRQILRVILPQHIVDIAPLSGPTIQSDLNQRDFSIDAMALHLSSGELIDPFGGRKDLSLKRVRMVSSGIFVKDPIRLLRTYRIAAQLGFEIEVPTHAAVSNHSSLIRQAAGERIRTELFTLFQTPRSHPYLAQMAGSGLLCAVFPEMSALRGCLQNRHHTQDVFNHTLRAYFHLEQLIREISIPQPVANISAGRLMTTDDAGMLKCAALLHDIGKPPTRNVAADGSVHFYGHARKGAEMTAAIGSRLKFSRRQRQRLDFIIRNHLRPLWLFTARRHTVLTPKALARFYRVCGDHTPHLLLHALADAQAKKDEWNFVDFETFIQDLLHRFSTDFTPLKTRPPLINGHDLIAEFKLTPSPVFKRILTAVEEARLSRQITSRAEALNLVTNILAADQKDLFSPLK